MLGFLRRPGFERVTTKDSIIYPNRRDRLWIRKVTGRIRQHLGLGLTDCLPLPGLFEHRMFEFFPGYSFEIVGNDDLPASIEAFTFWDARDETFGFYDGPRIVITERVYHEFLSDQGRARFTIAHEIGHCFLHFSLSPMALSPQDRADHRTIESQANFFAGELLMPVEAFEKWNHVRDLCRNMGVSQFAAEYRSWKLDQEFLLSNDTWQAIARKAKKNLSKGNTQDEAVGIARSALQNSVFER